MRFCCQASQSCKLKRCLGHIELIMHCTRDITWNVSIIQRLRNERWCHRNSANASAARRYSRAWSVRSWPHFAAVIQLPWTRHFVYIIHGSACCCMRYSPTMLAPVLRANACMIRSCPRSSRRVVTFASTIALSKMQASSWSGAHAINYVLLADQPHIVAAALVAAQRFGPHHQPHSLCSLCQCHPVPPV